MWLDIQKERSYYNMASVQNNGSFVMSSKFCMAIYIGTKYTVSKEKYPDIVKIHRYSN